MRPFSILLKPVGSACNLNCSYCFYSSHPSGAISEETLGKMLSSYADLPFSGKSVTLQGGEPLLAPGYVFDALEAYPLMRSLQTNATLLTPETALHLKKAGWLVGASLDGDKIANRLRQTASGDPSAAFEAAVAGIRLLEDANVDYNLLTVVSEANAGNAAEVYRYLRDNFKTRFHQYIECTGPQNSITAGQWGDFLIALFDEWAKKDAYSVSIRIFDSIVSRLVRGEHTQCSLAPRCDGYLVVEHDGSVYPCDFHVREDLKLGNVLTHTWEEMLESGTYRRFAAAKTAPLPEKCRECPYVKFCNGDCPRSRRNSASVLCEGWRKFFAHSLERFREIIESAP